MKIKLLSVRNLVQIFFLFVVLKIGYQFYGFVRYCETTGKTPFFERPPGVEAFLPISSLMSLKHLFLTGDINPIHPSGLIILIAILFIAIFLKKAFCSWICPVSFLSEFLWKLRRKIFKSDFKIPLLPDSILRSLKYLVLIFFVWVIFIRMDLVSLETFIFSPYNRIADVKMLMFFSDISTVTLVVISILLILSFAFNNFWCRYLCPYGALLGFTSIISPFKITRNITSCTNCKKCSKVCPEFIKVHSHKRVFSDECMACLACVEACPVDNTLEFKLKKSRLKFSSYGLAAAILVIYFSFVSYGKLTGHWENDISLHEYMVRIKDIDKPIYDHNRGRIVTDESIIIQ